MSKIIDYRIVVSGDVKGFMGSGWEPFGGPIVDIGDRHNHIVQAMVKRRSQREQDIIDGQKIN